MKMHIESKTEPGKALCGKKARHVYPAKTAYSSGTGPVCKDCDKQAANGKPYRYC